MGHRNMDSLKKALEAKAKKVLANEVANVVKTQMGSSIQEEVYGVYTPAPEKYGGYVRTYQFANRENMKSTVTGSLQAKSSVVLSVTHQDPRGISELIILGQEGAKRYGTNKLYDEYYISQTKMNWLPYHANDSKGFWEDRNFISATKSELRKTKVLQNAFKEGMKK